MSFKYIVMHLAELHHNCTRKYRILKHCSTKLIQNNLLNTFQGIIVLLLAGVHQTAPVINYYRVFKLVQNMASQ